MPSPHRTISTPIRWEAIRTSMKWPKRAACVSSCDGSDSAVNGLKLRVVVRDFVGENGFTVPVLVAPIMGVPSCDRLVRPVGGRDRRERDEFMTAQVKRISGRFTSVGRR